jgi:hypothetical protein
MTPAGGAGVFIDAGPDPGTLPQRPLSLFDNFMKGMKNLAPKPQLDHSFICASILG